MVPGRRNGVEAAIAPVTVPRLIAPLPPRFIVAEDPESPPPGLAGAVVAIGNFDGVHRGHQAVIGRAKALADELGRPTAVLTFEPHPGDYFAGTPTIFRITPPAAKALALSRLGTVDGMVVRGFDAGFAALGAEDFVADVLVRRLGIAAAVVGYDFHFGRGRAGTPAYLAEAGVRHGFAVAVIDKIVADARGDLAAVSSTAIRRALEGGDVARAATLLGRHHFVLGQVVHGEKLGRTLGFPTANLQARPCGEARPRHLCRQGPDRDRASMAALPPMAAARLSTMARRCSKAFCSTSPAISTARISRSISSAGSGARRSSPPPMRWWCA